MFAHNDGKIALEEHFYLPTFEAYGADSSAVEGASKAHNYDPTYFAFVQKQFANVNLWLDEMDHGGIERMVLSLTQPGIQGIPDRTIAINTAKRVNELATIGGKSSCANFPHTVSFLAAFARGYLRYFFQFPQYFRFPERQQPPKSISCVLARETIGCRLTNASNLLARGRHMLRMVN
jgi:hypothetical protein